MHYSHILTPSLIALAIIVCDIKVFKQTDKQLAQSYKINENNVQKFEEETLLLETKTKIEKKTNENNC